MTGIYQRCHPVRDEEARRQWALTHEYCQVCKIFWKTAIFEQGFGLEVHHICKFGRSDEKTNFLRVCRKCHLRCEGLPVEKKLTLAEVLRIKKKYDPTEFNAERLQELYGETLPEF